MMNPFDIAARLRANGVVGINERNAEYTLPYNPRDRYPLVDDKVLTKELAVRAGAAVPELYGVIEIQRQVRGLPVDKALSLLAFSPKKGAKIIRKVLESAIANAEHNQGADIDELTVTTIHVEQGTSLKRFMPRAKGRGFKITKPTCHIYVTVGDKE